MMHLFLQSLSHPFLFRAMIVGVLISLCAALVGVSLVLKRYAMMGDGLSHVGFGALSVGVALHLAPLSVAIPAVVIAAFFLLSMKEDSKLRGDASLALLSTSMLAFGVLVISSTKGVNIDINNYMFGSILTLTNQDLFLTIALSILVVVLFYLLYDKIFAVTFDETFARACGMKADIYNGVIAVLTALIIVLGMRMMGTLLISSLTIFPAITAMQICKQFRAVVLMAAALSLICFFLGFVFSYLYGVPTGASVVVVNLLFFLVCYSVSAIQQKISGGK